MQTDLAAASAEALQKLLRTRRTLLVQQEALKPQTAQLCASHFVANVVSKVSEKLRKKAEEEQQNKICQLELLRSPTPSVHVQRSWLGHNSEVDSSSGDLLRWIATLASMAQSANTLSQDDRRRLAVQTREFRSRHRDVVGSPQQGEPPTREAPKPPSESDPSDDGGDPQPPLSPSPRSPPPPSPPSSGVLRAWGNAGAIAGGVAGSVLGPAGAAAGAAAGAVSGAAAGAVVLPEVWVGSDSLSWARVPRHS